MTLLFVTTSDDKITEARRILHLPVAKSTLHLVEPQSVEIDAVVTAKAQQAFEALQRPVVVDDSGLFVASWNGLPGALVRWFIQRLGVDGICTMLDCYPSREAVARTAIGYSDGDVRVYHGEVHGRVSESPRGRNGFGFDSIFIPDGSEKTYAEMEPAEKDTFSMRRLAFESLLLDAEIARRLA